MVDTSKLPTLTFHNARAWNAWLKKNHAKSPGIWMQIAKKGAAQKSATYAEAVEEALCWGWIDGQKAPLDAHAWLQKFTPRGPRSMWSKINRGKAAELIFAERMQPPGHAAIARAQQNGRWTSAYDPQSKAKVPPDLRAALTANPRAAEFFKTLNGGNRYGILFRLQDAKRPETRARRLAQMVAMLERGEKLHP